MKTTGTDFDDDADDDYNGDEDDNAINDLKVRSANPDSSVDVVPALVQCRQLQLDILLVPSTLVDELHRNVSQLIHLRCAMVTLRHKFLHKHTTPSYWTAYSIGRSLKDSNG